MLCDNKMDNSAKLNKVVYLFFLKSWIRMIEKVFIMNNKDFKWTILISSIIRKNLFTFVGKSKEVICKVNDEWSNGYISQSS